LYVITCINLYDMKKIIHTADSRGFQDHGWLKAAHSFSFGNYYDPKRSHFGLLRVLNDDIVAPAMGFGTHGHDNMEIVTIPLKGSLAHKDSLGSEGLIEPGEVQIMSAGSGIRHSEFNGSKTENVNLLQIWVFPKERNIQPRYDQRRFDNSGKNTFTTLVSPDPESGAMWINQDAFFSKGNFEEGKSISYKIKHPGNGAYVYIIEGEVKLAEETLGKRDAIGIFDTDEFEINVTKDSIILVIDVPME
jgi:redox-sensitive bicupin YhaK (pirin superfamily)